MLPVCVSEDVDAAKALLRRRLVHYALLPNYRAYWKEAGYADEMSAVEKAIADNRPDDIPKYLTDRWLADNTLFGLPAKVRDGVEEWRAAGVNTPTSCLARSQAIRSGPSMSCSSHSADSDYHLSG